MGFVKTIARKFWDEIKNLIGFFRWNLSSIKSAFDKDILKQFVVEIIKNMDELLASPEPPKFNDALQNSMIQIKKTEAAI